MATDGQRVEPGERGRAERTSGTPSHLIPFHIGTVRVDPPLVLAPMAGVTSWPFRVLCRRHGAGLVCSEMISAEALCYGSRRTMDMLASHRDERPLSVQLLAASGDRAERAARMAAEAGADIVDVNFGCFVPKVRKSGGGCALMADLNRAKEVIQGAVAGAADAPVTVKMRAGVDEGRINAVAVAELAEGAGAAAVTVHPRTGVQLFSGKADWSVIANVKASVAIPVIGNGDVRQPEDALRMWNQTGCDGVMIGRAALGDPWAFERIIAYCRRGDRLPKPPARERLRAAVDLAGDLVDHIGERNGVQQSRKHLGWFSKGLPRSAEFRRLAYGVTTLGHIKEVVSAYLASLEAEDR